jgi:hypothetical protein
LFWLFRFIMGLASVIEADTRHRHHGRWEYTRVGDRACSETSAFGAFDPVAILLLSSGGYARPRRPGLSRHQHRGAQTTKEPHVRPSVGNDASANVAC